MAWLKAEVEQAKAYLNLLFRRGVTVAHPEAEVHPHLLCLQIHDRPLRKSRLHQVAQYCGKEE